MSPTVHCRCRKLTIGDNHAATAAGIETFQSAATIRYSTIANNEASQFGGGVMVVAGSLLLDGSIVAKNTGTLALDIARGVQSDVTHSRMI